MRIGLRALQGEGVIPLPAQREEGVSLRSHFAGGNHAESTFNKLSQVLFGAKFVASSSALQLGSVPN